MQGFQPWLQKCTKGFQPQVLKCTQGSQPQVHKCTHCCQQILGAVCLCEFQVEILSQYANLNSFRMFQNVPECMKLKFFHSMQIKTVSECSRMFQNACRMFQNVQVIYLGLLPPRPLGLWTKIIIDTDKFQLLYNTLKSTRALPNNLCSLPS